MAKDEKLKALELALIQIEKDFGKEAIMKLGEKSAKIRNSQLQIMGKTPCS